MNGATTFVTSLDKNIRSSGSSGLLKVWLLQCHVVLWIHNIDAICTCTWKLTNVTFDNLML